MMRSAWKFRVKLRRRSRRLAMSFIALLSVGGNVLHADDYSWLGVSGSWKDPEIWVNPLEPTSQTYPTAGDVANINGSGTISLDGESVFTANIASGSVGLSGGSLAVLGTNLLRVGITSHTTLNLLGGASISANGTVIGLGATGTTWIYGGASLNDSHEIDIGYTNLGYLNIEGGGSATSSGPIFIGGFSSGTGDVLVTGQAASLKGNGPFIVVGNLGKGTMIVDGGGTVTSANDFIIAGFSSGIGSVSLNDGNSALQVDNSLSVGSFGEGSLTINSGASATAKSILVGAGSTAEGATFVNGSGATLNTNGGPLTVGNDGNGLVLIGDGAHANIQGANSFVSIGANSSSDGSISVIGNGSQLNVGGGSLTVGRDGSALLAVLAGGKTNSQGLQVSAGFSTSANVVIDGSGSAVQANGFADIGMFGNGSVTILGGGKLSSQVATLGLVSGTGIVSIDGQGSTWEVGQQLTIGVAGEGGMLIREGGSLSAPTIYLGQLESGTGSLALFGPNSKIDGDVGFGLLGRGSFHLRQGAKYAFDQTATLVNAKGSMLTVEDAGSAVECRTVVMGAPTAQGKAVFRAAAGGSAVVSGDILMSNGELDVGQGSTITVTGGIGGGVPADSFAEINVQGVGARLVANKIALGKSGAAILNITGGGVAQTQLLGVATDGSEGSMGSILVGANSALIVGDGLTFSGPKALQLSVQAGGYVGVRSYANLGNATLSLNGGSIDVGMFSSPSLANFVRVGPGGEFHSASAISNVHNSGGIVQAGSSPGVMTVEGDFIQDASSILRFSIAGVDPEAGYSQLVVKGNLQLSGTLRFVFEDDFEPQPGQFFDLIHVEGTAQLNNVQLQIQNLAPGFLYDFFPIQNGYRLTALSAATFEQEFQLGDFNRDGNVTLTDLHPMLLALANLSEYQRTHDMAADDLISVGDLDGSGKVTNADIQPMLNLLALGGGSINGVPEPEALPMAGMAAALLVVTRFVAKRSARQRSSVASALANTL